MPGGPRTSRRETTMSKKDFIKENKQQIDEYIRHQLNDPGYILNNHEREMWILNDEHLYLWARRSGVKV
jgi:hypothetical protein